MIYRTILFGVFISYAASYSICPWHVECIPGCVKIDERGCKLCACGPMMFHPGAGYHGMPGGTLSEASFRPGTLGGGSMFGSNQGGTSSTSGSGYHAVTPVEKPLKECTGTMLCMMTCKERYSLSKDVQSNGCRACTCPKQQPKPEVHQVVQVVEKPQPKPETHSTVLEPVQYVKPVTHTDCTGTKLCMMTCKGKYVLGDRGTDGCQSCACIPEPEPQRVVVQPVTERQCHETVLCMLSCKHGYSLAPKCSDGCHEECQKCTCLEPTPAPVIIQPIVEHKVECPKTLECMLQCKDGYHLGSTGSDGCPACSCLAPARVQVVYEVKCARALSCPRGCSVGYKCNKDGCPTCDCIEPQVVGVLTVHEIHTTQAVTCSAALMCPKSCSLGYKCGSDGCPTCECLVEVHTDRCTDGCDSHTSGGTGTSMAGFGSSSINAVGSGGQGMSGTSSPFNIATGGGSGTGSGLIQQVNGGGAGHVSQYGNYDNAHQYHGGGGGSGLGMLSSIVGGATSGGMVGSGSGSSNGDGNGSGAGMASPFAISTTNSGNGIGANSVSSTGGNENTMLGGGTGMGSPFAVGATGSGNGLGGNGGSVGHSMGSYGNPFVTGGGGSNGGGNGTGPFNTASITGGNGTGPFNTASVTGGNGSPFASNAGSNWQSGSGNGKGWSTGGVDGPFSNGQGSGYSSGQFHNMNGSGQGMAPANGFGSHTTVGQTQTGAIVGSGMSSVNQHGQAPGTNGQGPFVLSGNTGGPANNDSGLPLSPYSVAGGLGAAGGPFAGAISSSAGSVSGNGAGSNSGPFNALSGLLTGTDSYGAGMSHLTDGSGGNIQQNIGGYGTGPFVINGVGGSVMGGLGNTLGPGAGPVNGGAGNGNGHNGSGTNDLGGGITNLLETIKDCPVALKCMQTCASGYDLHTSNTETCPICTCAAGSGTTAPNLIQEGSVASKPTGCPKIFTCPARCVHGFACNKHGCPMCDCVGQPDVELLQVAPIQCTGDFKCPASCRQGYKCGQDGCPTCDCLSVTSVKPLVTAPTPAPVNPGVSTLVSKCPATIRCMANCANGYTLGAEGRDGCPACTCVNVKTSVCHDVCENKPLVAVHTCDATLQCMAGCTDGYVLHETGSDGCPRCTCKQPVCRTGCEERVVQVLQTTSGCGSRDCTTSCTGDCNSSGGLAIHLVSGGTLTSGTVTGNGGGAAVGGTMSGGGGVLSAGGGNIGTGQECAPLPSNCHPYCIKYDVAHCRKCECENARSLPYDISDECLLLAVVAFYWDAWYPVRVNINGLDVLDVEN